MSHNNYFQFKQFRVEQNHAAMRVGTDGVLLGAWVNVQEVSTILDIGTGTGLIAIMLAQRNAAAQLDAIDIEKGAIKDARFNFEHSPWNNRLKLFHSSLQEFAENSDKRYDCIVSNPPFFDNHMKSERQQRALARHTESLSYTELIENVSKLLHPSGTFCLILPIDSEDAFIQHALKSGLHLTKKTRVIPNPQKSCKRVLLQFEFEQKKFVEDELIIETSTKHQYTEEAIKLFKEFYLNL